MKKVFEVSVRCASFHTHTAHVVSKDIERVFIPALAAAKRSGYEGPYEVVGVKRLGDAHHERERTPAMDARRRKSAAKKKRS